MTAYVIFELSPLDPVRMKAYLDAAYASLKPFSSNLLAATNEVDTRDSRKNLWAEDFRYG